MEENIHSEHILQVWCTTIRDCTMKGHLMRIYANQYQTHYYKLEEMHSTISWKRCTWLAGLVAIAYDHDMHI